jgi:transcription antitermination factor NusG
MAAVNDIAVKHWLALYTKPRHEFKAAIQLESVSIEYYLPTFTAMKKWSDRKKKIIEPLFRSYIFIHVDEKERWLAISQSTIVRAVCFNGKPSVIPDWQIENLKKMLIESPEVFVTNKIEVGTKVKIVDGPFKDVIGVVTSAQEDKWLAVSVELLRCSVMVRLTKESVLKFL